MPDTQTRLTKPLATLGGIAGFLWGVSIGGAQGVDGSTVLIYALLGTGFGMMAGGVAAMALSAALQILVIVFEIASIAVPIFKWFS